jgi:hypothetical protein
MEASYVTRLQCAGQDKRNTVACEDVHWVEVAKGKDKAEGRNGKIILEMLSSKMQKNFHSSTPSNTLHLTVCCRKETGKTGMQQC